MDIASCLIEVFEHVHVNQEYACASCENSVPEIQNSLEVSIAHPFMCRVDCMTYVVSGAG